MPQAIKYHQPFGAKEARQSRERHADRKRGSSAARGYDSLWRARARRIKARDKYLCQQCKRDGILRDIGRKGHVDHIIPKSAGGTDDDSNLESLCHSCHSRKTAREDGGFGNKPRRRILRGGY